MSQNDRAEPLPPSPAPARSTGWLALVTWLRDPSTLFAFAIGGALAMCYWALFRKLPEAWFSSETYYAYGAIVPLSAAFIVYDRWHDLRKIPIKGAWIALLPLFCSLYLTFVVARTARATSLSVLFVLTSLFAVWFVAGGRWARAVAIPICYLILAFPIWDVLIDAYTQPMQELSTDGAYLVLSTIGQDPMRSDATTILLPHFSMVVGGPCSGLKLILAVVAITLFFIMVARLKWWGNAVLAAVALPMCLLLNTIRISAVGIVGNTYGQSAGLGFHDTSGYIVLVLCFLAMLQITRWLGWKS